jgi:hypothetical protein
MGIMLVTIYKFTDRRANVLDIETVRANFLTHEGEVFRQIHGSEFTYRVPRFLGMET